jgi:hypothetical protein
MVYTDQNNRYTYGLLGNVRNHSISAHAVSFQKPGIFELIVSYTFLAG